MAILADCLSFLLFDSEALFFVDDDKSELFKVYVFTEESMGADQYVDAAFGGLLDGISVLCSGVEPADASDVDGQSGKAFIEGVGMLLAKDGGGHEQGDLFAESAALTRQAATSVLPKPTSPQMRRSIGRSFSISALVSSIALN